ncbi:MAG: protein tyrosine phosphatase family protein [Halieaceae bacterium]
MSILNQFQIAEDIGTSGQPTREQFQEIAEQGYEVVINLAMPDHADSIENEGSIVTSLGMSYIHIPVPFDSPNKDHLDMFTGYMNALVGKKVWVHCIVNARVSAFLYCYLQQERGFSSEAASSPVLSAWLPDMDDSWKNFIRQAGDDNG